MPPAEAPRAAITLTSDFGLTDWYVASLKAVLLASAPPTHVVDITHAVPAGDVVYGSIVLERAVSVFPAGTIHLAVVDPGVGSTRRILIARCREQLVVCPDNGLITWMARRHAPVETFELTWRPETSSATFHGRDIMAPAAGALASGAELSSLARPIRDPVLLALNLAAEGASVGQVLYIDRFGNAITNIPAASFSGRANVRVRVGGRDIGPIRQTYGDVRLGEPLALVGSSDLLEISVRDGSAAEVLGVRVGSEVVLYEEL